MLIALVLAPAMRQQKPILLSVERDEHEMIAKRRQLFGTGEDLDAWEARTLYSGLLPRVLAHDTEQPLPELWCRARAAAIARRAAKRYVRERSQLLVRLFAHLIDATRHNAAGPGPGGSPPGHRGAAYLVARGGGGPRPTRVRDLHVGVYGQAEGCDGDKPQRRQLLYRHG